MRQNAPICDKRHSPFLFFTDFWKMNIRRAFAAKYVFHFLMWIIVLISLAMDVPRLYLYDKGLFVYFVFAKTLIQAALVYVNILLLYPAFYKQKRYILYGLFVILITLLAGYANMKLEIHVNRIPAFPSARSHFFFFLSQLGMAARYLLISFLLKITVDFYEQKELMKKIELEKATAELNFLKAQVNPHFLFNTLNSLYALILEKSDKSGEAVLKLADIMKYILAEGKEDRVLLKKEMEMLYNYTELERLRRPDAEIRFTTGGDTERYYITPLLLLPLVENAFKYGLNSVAKNGFVRIGMDVRNDTLVFTVENNLPPVQNSEAYHSFGIGIENVNRRLQMLYEKKYRLNIQDNPGSFFVHLQLQLR